MGVHKKANTDKLDVGTYKNGVRELKTCLKGVQEILNSSVGSFPLPAIELSSGENIVIIANIAEDGTVSYTDADTGLSIIEDNHFSFQKQIPSTTVHIRVDDAGTPLTSYTATNGVLVTNNTFTGGLTIPNGTEHWSINIVSGQLELDGIQHVAPMIIEMPVSTTTHREVDLDISALAGTVIHINYEIK